MGGVWRTAKRRKQTCVGALRLKRGSCSSGGVWRTAKRDSTRYFHLHRRPPPASTSYCSSTVDLRQPPPATVHPRAPAHPASTARYSTGYCSTTPLPSTIHHALHTMGSYSTTPPRPPLHRLLFNQHSTPRVPVHPEATPPLTVHPTPRLPATLTVHPRGSIDRLQKAAVAKESLDRVQLTAIDRSLRFSNA